MSPRTLIRHVIELGREHGCSQCGRDLRTPRPRGSCTQCRAIVVIVAEARQLYQQYRRQRTQRGVERPSHLRVVR